MNTVLAIHGFTGSPLSWDRVAEHLGDRVRVLRPTLSGHAGRSVDADSFVAEVDRIARELEELSKRPVHLAGYSLGGRIALGLLARHGALIHSATLVGAHPGLREPAERQARLASDEAWARMLREDGLVPFVDAWERQPLFASQAKLPEDVRARRRAERLAQDPCGVADALAVLGLGHMPPWHEHLPRVTVPVTLVAGAEDEKFTALSAELVRLMPRARLHVVPSVGHDVVLEAPDAVAALILEAIPHPSAGTGAEGAPGGLWR